MTTEITLTVGYQNGEIVAVEETTAITIDNELVHYGNVPVNFNIIRLADLIEDIPLVNAFDDGEMHFEVYKRVYRK